MTISYLKWRLCKPKKGLCAAHASELGTACCVHRGLGTDSRVCGRTSSHEGLSIHWATVSRMGAVVRRWHHSQELRVAFMGLPDFVNWHWWGFQLLVCIPDVLLTFPEGNEFFPVLHTWLLIWYIRPKYWDNFKYFLPSHHPPAPIFTKFGPVSQIKSLESAFNA